MAPQTSSSVAKTSRPLSAWNLFYRYKRAKIVEAKKRAKHHSNKDDIQRFVKATPGLEDYPNVLGAIPPGKLDELRKFHIRAVLEPQLLSRDTRSRLHRKSSGLGLGFIEMNRLVVDAWKAKDELTKAVFQALADQGRREYKEGKMLANLQRQLQSTDALQQATSTEATVVETPPVAATKLMTDADDGPKLDATWEPLPFKTNNEGRALASGAQPHPDAPQASVRTSPTWNKQALPAVVTPTLGGKPFVSADANASGCHAAFRFHPVAGAPPALPSQPFLADIASPPFADENARAATFGAASADDFAELIAALE